MRFLVCFLTLVLYFKSVIAQESVAEIIKSDPPKNLLEASSFIQNDSLVFYFNRYYEIVKPDCAEIYRFSKIDTTTAKFTGRFIDFYHDSTIIAEGSYNNGVKEGLYKIYYLNGKLKGKGLYKDGKKTGIWVYWYDSGTIKLNLNCDYELPRIIDLWDEDGKKIVNNGKGFYKVIKSANLFKLEGLVDNGYQEGEWKYSISSHASYNETYKKGKLIKAIHKFPNGEEEYTDKVYCGILEKEYIDNSEKYIAGNCYFSNEYGLGKVATLPEFEGGKEAFMRFVSRGLQYPEEAAKRGIQGRVYLQFVIETDGKVTNVSLLKTDSQLLVNEAIRVVKSSPKWKPGTLHGKPVRCSITFPITFVLQQ